MPKTVLVYGVEMTSLQEMHFSKYLSSYGIAMNTLQPSQRTELAVKWLMKELSGSTVADSHFISCLLHERRQYARVFGLDESRTVYNPLIKHHIRGLKEKRPTRIFAS